MSTLSRACPTCGGPVDEVWLAGRHAPERGPEESACGRCGEALSSARHRAEFESRFPTVDRLAEALHAIGGEACATDHAAAGISGREAIRRYHRARAEALLAALRGG